MPLQGAGVVRASGGGIIEQSLHVQMCEWKIRERRSALLHSFLFARISSGIKKQVKAGAHQHIQQQENSVDKI